MLRGADLSVTEICHLVGFSSLGTFSARFKARTGLTPSAYRREHVGRGAALIPGCYAMLWAGGFPTARAAEGTARRAAEGTPQRAGKGTAQSRAEETAESTATLEKRPAPAAAYGGGDEPPDDRRAEP